MDQQSKASQYLWENLLINKGFYAYAFHQNTEVLGEKIDFFCDELQMAILFKKGSAHSAPKFINEGYKVVIIEAAEVLSDFEGVVEYLTNTLKDIVGQPCGGW